MSTTNNPDTTLSDSQALLNTIREHYHSFVEVIQILHNRGGDVYPIQRFGEDLQEFSRIVDQYSGVFDSIEELHLLQQNLQKMLIDVQALYDHAVNSTHQGRPPLVQREYTGGRGRPKTTINPEFLSWAYTQRSITGISRFLGVGRTTVRQALLDLGIAVPGQDPFPDRNQVDTEPDDLLDPDMELPAQLPDDVPAASPSSRTLPGYLSDISDTDLDLMIFKLKLHFPRAGIRILDGMLRRLGHVVPYERIRLSLERIDPVHRVFKRITLRRRGYSVPGPNYLWHHDGQHGLIRWRIVIHAFIDGYSRLVTGIKASNNNRADTVLLLFLAAVAVYGIPSRVRGDHGVENLLVAAFMEYVRGPGRGSYIWGRSVHNTRIERLWVDVKIGVVHTWNELFEELEIRFGLEYLNPNHLWLLQWLFLPVINDHLQFWAESWNHHKITVRQGPNRSPHDFFGFDMFACGFRGDALQSLPLDEDELEVFGIDWEGLYDDRLLTSLRQNYAQDGGNSWIGRRGPPPELTEVLCDPPPCSLSETQVAELGRYLERLPRSSKREDVVSLWTNALACARLMAPGVF
ncbi:hypothetical protein VNI00_008798 [Paramarasmius palmivorus]|uniref:Integrase catalytic domain-containing protein n=1 Tax=Paramarasmius palmivorus TaxID=297713 RepID=A0AAW0CVI0_9AGAR